LVVAVVAHFLVVAVAVDKVALLRPLISVEMLLYL
jgi:hypothetical protein